MFPELSRLLDYLSEHLDHNRLQKSDERFMKSLCWEQVDRPPVVVSSPLPEAFAFRPLPVREIFESPEKMLYNELVHAYDLSVAASPLLDHDLPWTVRANSGTVLLASMYGARVEQVGDNPPWVLHEGMPELPLASIASDAPESLLDCGWLPRVRETMAVYHEILSAYPALAGSIKITLPDLQGPFDNFEHIRGNDAFLDLIDEPGLAREAMSHVAATQVAVARSLDALISDGPEGFSHQHGFMIRGRILLRCDSVIMLSPEMYRDQVAEHDNHVLEAMGGGGIHSCGNISRLVPEYLKLPALECIDLGQSELCDRNTIYQLARERTVGIVRMHATSDELSSGWFKQQFPTGVAVICREDKFPNQPIHNKT